MYTHSYCLLTKTGEELNIKAKALDVDDLQIVEFEFETYDCNMNPISIAFNQMLFDDIEQDCHEEFYREKYGTDALFNSRAEEE